MIEKGFGIRGVQEGHCCRTLVSPHKDVEQKSTPDSASNVPMGGAVGEVHQLNGSDALALVVRPPFLLFAVAGPAEWGLSVARHIIRVVAIICPSGMLISSITMDLGAESTKTVVVTVSLATSLALLPGKTGLWRRLR